VSDPWEDEGFGGEDDWQAQESIASGLEDDGEDEPELDEPGDDELHDDDAPELGL
jgi:hypothetical protein